MCVCEHICEGVSEGILSLCSGIARCEIQLQSAWSELKFSQFVLYDINLLPLRLEIYMQ